MQIQKPTCFAFTCSHTSYSILTLVTASSYIFLINLTYFRGTIRSCQLWHNFFPKKKKLQRNKLLLVVMVQKRMLNILTKEQLITHHQEFCVKCIYADVIRFYAETNAMHGKKKLLLVFMLPNDLSPHCQALLCSSTLQNLSSYPQAVHLP